MLLTRTAPGPPGNFDLRGGLVERVLVALATPERSSVILVGPRDVGKTALVHEIARRLVTGAVPPALAGAELWRISANDLIADARYTGMWQGRGRLLIQHAKTTRAIFAMGDPVAIVDAGRWSQSDNNLGRLLKPYVENGEVTLICECTSDEFAAAHRHEPGFVNAFPRVDIAEPSTSEAQAILDRTARRIERAQSIGIDAEAVGAALDLTKRFEPYRGLPGKAVRLLEETANAMAATGTERVTRADVVQAFTARTGLPVALLSDEVPIRASEVAEHFQARVLGQAEAVECVTDLVMVLKAALNDVEKPLGTFLFMGPTGLGKTELAKALAEFLFGSRARLVRLDMGEYSTGDAVQRLAGTTWGRQTEGELTRRVQEQPFCVVLLDEIEKAQWSAFDALLAVAGEGRLTDAAGQTADFRSAILIMTSNLGANRQESAALGFTAGEDADAAASASQRGYIDAAERFFRPEFFNRLDRIVVFRPLMRDTVRRIAQREVGRLLLREGIVRQQLVVEVDETAINLLAERGFHPSYGARPLQREIERAVIHPLARLLVERRPPAGDLIQVTVDAGRIQVDVRRVTLPEPSPKPPSRHEPAFDGRLVRTAGQVDALIAEIEAEDATSVVRGLRAELSHLVLRTNDPDFWDDASQARASMSRTYEVQRVLDRWDALRERASGLAELARHMRSARDRRRLPELRSAIADIEARLELLRLELGGASLAGGVSDAVVKVFALGPDGVGWANELLAMYRAWAGRTDRDAVVDRDRDGAPALRISGPASYELLVTEVGLHRRVLGEGRTMQARVVVARAEVGAPTHEERTIDYRAVIVRVYDEARRQVRDPRTGVQVRNPQTVLQEGRIDAFLLGAIRTRHRDSSTSQ